MGRESSGRSRGIAPVAALLVLALTLGTPVSGHRLDEYLQAARIDLEPDRIVVELGLTPGAAVAARVVAAIDRDRNRQISDDEARAYGRRVLRDLHVTLDGRPVPLAMVDHQFPAVAAILAGEGTIRFRLAAVISPIEPGDHRLHFRNDHRPGISVYLANALAPGSSRVEVLRQERSADQRDVIITYRLRALIGSPRITGPAAHRRVPRPTGRRPGRAHVDA